jgi:hypothetical protein
MDSVVSLDFTKLQNQSNYFKSRLAFDGSQIYHNYIRPHMGLEGKTPAEACGIKIQGDNKWLTLIQNAKRKN